MNTIFDIQTAAPSSPLPLPSSRSKQIKLRVDYFEKKKKKPVVKNKINKIMKKYLLLSIIVTCLIVTEENPFTKLQASS